ncbi:MULTISPECIES: hypothetical protein [unclassified Amycolatopsis]|uniref:hypothetical protein n=1 Tax=unclassified Amycolatopsis TaxID=2618356 RepID=UPI0003A4979B|nr:MULTISPECIES: hypothetical protein [unclassified Amycolatopsis]
MTWVDPVRTRLWSTTEFVDLMDCTERPHTRYGEDLTGAILLTVSGVVILDENLASEIEGLWSAVAHLVAEYRKIGTARSLFPDQSLELALDRVSRGLVRITVSGSDFRRTSVGGEADLLSALVAGGLQFFEKMAELTQSFYAREIQLLEDQQ